MRFENAWGVLGDRFSARHQIGIGGRADDSLSSHATRDESRLSHRDPMSQLNGSKHVGG